MPKGTSDRRNIAGEGGGGGGGITMAMTVTDAAWRVNATSAVEERGLPYHTYCTALLACKLYVRLTVPVPLPGCCSTRRDEQYSERAFTGRGKLKKNTTAPKKAQQSELDNFVVES